jgi:Uma2 family endonuclease
MATANLSNLSNLISIEEYLSTSYRPDVDYVDGEIEERNLGEFDHADLQFGIANLLRNKQKDWSIRVVGESRVRVSPTRVRIPDVCVLSADLPRERIITHPPLLCVEILSPRDTLKSMRKRAQDFFDMGVKDIWIFAPETRTAHACTASTMTEHKTGILRVEGTKIEISIEEAFSTLDS